MLIGEAREEVFKEALGSFPSGVTIITVRDQLGRPCGMTANAFSSVSLTPLLILICLNRTTRTHSDVSTKGRFGVNILHRTAVDISNYCSRPGHDKVLRPEWLHETDDPDQPPILTGALAYLDCTVNSQVEAGTHAIVVGQVNAVGMAEASDLAPLVYFRGRYCELKGTDSISA
jgi:flavin reductase (DIM6/NTAB) family NADH-FMN oxidoreductase RutF